MSNARRHNISRGFTLIELIVALSIVAIMSVFMYQSVQVAFRAQSSAEAAVEPSRTAELAMEFLRQDIENAMPPGSTTGGTAIATGKLSGNFVGTDGTDDRGHSSDDLNFYTTANAADHLSANGEIKNVELLMYIPDGSSDHVLARRVTRNLLTDLAVTPDEEILCRGVSGFNLRFFDGTDWQDTWDITSEYALPAAVEVTLELERPTNSGVMQTLRFTRVFQVACTASGDEAPDAVDGVAAP